MSSENSRNDTVLGPNGAYSPSSVVTVFVCTSCGLPENTENPTRSDGLRLFDDLNKRAASRSNINIQAVDCLAVCDRSVTVAFTAARKWTYVIGDVDAVRDQDDILSVAQSILRSESGVPAMIDRPPFFKKGVISRLPPVPSPDADS